ncbi:aryl-alcohol dehydrogenase-like predicted oxidoreductase [Scopulibacillus darangshiensis]|uniref:Aryl-alcohol dehydrogenase-like predicted oxidoreductase n=1 Tax=Scopulibacillus darangshiensis TaxID=442528 RepID=A0A4R2P9L0_9BACL|nr:aldo/keto reductase [Scopulibacillus darangshiensis]TCP31740.1 aryl-alcohol dehydrogenase-like predicted oxidoreductase [Scopulibacillus darangshiensis]
MNKNQLGSSDLYVSEIGFGSMSLPQNEKEAIYLVEKAIDEGINFIDTADLYDFGRIEEVLGKALKGKREKVILTTKAGNHWEPGRDGWYWDPSKAYIKEAVKKSLMRLKTDYIDLYQLHGGTIDDPIDETIDAFEELKQEGVIRHYGISSIRPNVIREYVKRSTIVSVLMQYSILDRRPEEEMLALLKENNISVIARGPVAKGILSDGGLDKISDRGFLDYNKDELQQLFGEYKKASDPNRSLSQTAIRYCLSHPAVASAIPGASKESQLLENVNTVNTPELSSDELKAIHNLSKANTYKQHR